MPDPRSLISKTFQTFMSEAPTHAQACAAAVQAPAGASALDEKTGALAYLAELAALRLESGVILFLGEKIQVENNYRNRESVSIPVSVRKGVGNVF